MAANKLQDVMTRSDATVEQTEQALMFNRKLWTVFIGEALSDSNPQPIEVRQKIANIAIFVLSQTLALQAVPQLDQFKSLIDINRNIAAGLSGRA
jgi:flagellar biosynthesis activator protein FlaF